jgi:hypothetical protein
MRAQRRESFRGCTAPLTAQLLFGAEKGRHASLFDGDKGKVCVGVRSGAKAEAAQDAQNAQYA